jgi:DNA ligase-1
MVGVDSKTGRPMPFQFLSQRIKRKYDIEKVRKEIPIRVRLFDITFLEKKTLFKVPLRERWKSLGEAVRPVDERFRLAEHLEGWDRKAAERFYKDSLSRGHEGIIVKNLESSYQPGRRVAGGWLKVKPTMENLDLVIIGATWGTGKRAGWLGSLVLGCLDENGEFLECGMLGTGIKEKGEGVTFDLLTRMLRPHIESEKGSSVKIRPRVVVEVAYEEIQKSPNYSSGFALRFPRAVRIREDRKPDNVDTVERIGKLYRQQKTVNRSHS